MSAGQIDAYPLPGSICKHVLKRSLPRRIAAMTSIAAFASATVPSDVSPPAFPEGMSPKLFKSLTDRQMPCCLRVHRPDHLLTHILLSDRANPRYPFPVQHSIDQCQQVFLCLQIFCSLTKYQHTFEGMSPESPFTRSLVSGLDLSWLSLSFAGIHGSFLCPLGVSASSRELRAHGKHSRSAGYSGRRRCRAWRLISVQ